MFTLFTLIIKHLRVNNNFASLFTLVFKHLRVNNNFQRPPESLSILLFTLFTAA